MMRNRRHWSSIRLTATLGLTLGALGFAAPSALAEDAEAINKRLYEQLNGKSSQQKIETVSGQLYIAKENIDANVIGDALAAMLDEQAGPGAKVAVQRSPRLNFEIRFPKNSADLTPEAISSLDELGKALTTGYADKRFVIGGHTDLDGDPEVNGPLSQARADSARDYLVDKHSIPADRLVARGFGAAEPLREVEESNKDKLYNRRVDLRPLR